MRLRVFVVGLFITAVIVIGVFHFGLQWKIRAKDFREFAEEKVSLLFQAKVKIGDIRLGFLNRVALKGIEIDADEASESLYEVRIAEVVFQYDFFSLLTQNLRAPSSVILESPEVSLPGELFPYALFEKLDFGGGARAVSSLKLVDGYIRYRIPSLNSTLEMQRVEGTFKPLGDGRYRLNLKAHLRGFLEGGMRIRGEVDVIKRTHRLQLDLDNVDFGRKLPIPLRDLTGRVRWEDDNLYFDRVKAMIHGWGIRLHGSLRQFMQKAILDMEWALTRKEPGIQGSMHVDLQQQQMRANFQLPEDRVIEARSQIIQNGFQYEFKDLIISPDYLGQAWLDFESGDYRIHLRNAKQGLEMVSNLRGTEFRLGLKLDHINFYGLDLVTAMDVHLIASDTKLDDRLWKFTGTFDTDYFILEFAPLEDFRGSFEVTPFGIRNLVSTWGKVFNLSGEASFQQPPEGKFNVRVNGFDLKNVRNFAAKPLPKKLGGLMEGKLKIEGPLKKPEIFGNFTIKSGTLGRLDYDLGVLQFRGFLPRLQLYDSHVMRGRTSFLLNGALDFSLDNLFYGMEIRTPEKFAIWKGWELNTNQEDGSIELDAGPLPAMTVQAGINSSGDALGDNSKKDEEDYIVIGPHFKF